MTEGREKFKSNNISNEPVEPMVKPLDTDMTNHNKSVTFLVIAAIALGVVSGVLFSGFGKAASINSSSNSTETAVSAGGKNVVGSSDTKTFKDCAKGKLVKNDGKITHEGTHVLVRPGGDSQNVYITSSVIDLDGFLNKNVEVCGQTNQGQKAGWLMDAGRVAEQ